MLLSQMLPGGQAFLGLLPNKYQRQNSMLILLHCRASRVPPTHAVPVFLDGAPRNVPRAPLSKRFTISAWVYASKAPPYDQARVAQLRAAELAAADVGFDASGEARQRVLSALLQAAAD